MKGSIKRRGKSWLGRVDVGVDRVTGKRKVRAISRPTKREVEEEIAKTLAAVQRGEHVDPSRLTVGAWLDTWFSTAIEPHKRPRSVETYRSVIHRHLEPALGSVPLQTLQPEDIEHYFADRRGKLSGATLAQHSAILYAALKSAELKKKIVRNPAALVENKPKRAKSRHEEALKHCWEAHEARQFLEVARKAGPQPAAFYTVALELGLRKAELCGLKWEDLDFGHGTIRVMRQLVRVGSAVAGRQPLFGPPKNGRIRTLDISPETCALLVAHRKHQAEVKIANRQSYNDRGLIFAKEERVKSAERLGDPLQANNIAEREFNPLIEKADVRRIKFHGLRHTSATLALQAGVPLKVVQERLGHQRIEVTMDIYAHALPSAQKDAARLIGGLLHD